MSEKRKAGKMIELTSEKLCAHIHPRGASLAGLWLKGHKQSLVLGSPDSAAYGPDLNFFGALVGPIANRVGGSSFKIDEEIFRLDANEGINALHGGPNGLFARTWDIVDCTEKHVRFRISLADGEGGLPGTREIEAVYSVSDEGVLGLEITARTDRLTPMNIAHHAYWNLDGRGSIDNHHLEIPAENFLRVDSDLLPTGEICPVADTVYDFRTSKKIVTEITLDVNMCLREERLEKPAKCATLTAPNAPRLEIFSTEPGLQIYNGTGLSALPARFHDDRAPESGAAIALEPQAWPDALRHDNFPSILLKPEDVYRQITEYRFSG